MTAHVRTSRQLQQVCAIRRHRGRPTAVVVALVFGLTISLLGCTTMIIPPTSPAEPVNVFVIDHGRTASLAIPASDGGMLRYAYGDWRYYALAKDSLWNGIAALLWPTQGALGRGTLEDPPTLVSVQQQVGSIEHVHLVRVAHSSVIEFERNMERLYQSRSDTAVVNVLYGMNFVHHPRPYTYFWNSNHAVASWLRELGCQTRGLAFHSIWHVEYATRSNVQFGSR